MFFVVVVVRIEVRPRSDNIYACVTMRMFQVTSQIYNVCCVKTHIEGSVK